MLLKKLWIIAVDKSFYCKYYKYLKTQNLYIDSVNRQWHLASVVLGSANLSKPQDLGPQAPRFYKSGQNTLKPYGFSLYLYF